MPLKSPTPATLHEASGATALRVRLRRDPATGKFFLRDLSRLGTTINGEAAPSSVEVVDGSKRDRDLETPLPDAARIGLAGVLFLDFRSLSNG